MKNLAIKLLCLFLCFTFLPLISFISSNRNIEDKQFVLFDKAVNKKIKVKEKEYVLMALCSEMPPTFHKEALKAQAVAIYTNAIREKIKGSEYIASVDSSKMLGFTNEQTLKQKWGKSFDTYFKKMKEAVDDTQNLVIKYKNSLIVAAYHSMSGGKTESAQNVWGGNAEYLISKDSEGDSFSPNFEMKTQIEISNVRTTLKNNIDGIFLPDDNNLIFTEIEYTEAGSVKSLMAGNVKLSGQKIRELFNLRSAYFSVGVEGENMVFTTKGYGHGVGLSQYGADFMARQGEGFEEILKHYYSGVQVVERS